MLDNVAEPGELTVRVKGQKIRDQLSLETLFCVAGLRIRERSELVELHDDYRPVMMWALY